MTDGDDCGAISGTNKWQGKAKYVEETCASASLSTTHPRLLDTDSNLGRRGGKP
jgi:hypothetical protein